MQDETTKHEPRADAGGRVHPLVSAVAGFVTIVLITLFMYAGHAVLGILPVESFWGIMAAIVSIGCGLLVYDSLSESG